VPIILEFGFPEGFRFPGPPRPQPPGPDGREQVLGRGWGFAVLVPWTVQPDDGAGLREGVIGFAAGRRPRDIARREVDGFSNLILVCQRSLLTRTRPPRS